MERMTSQNYVENVLRTESCDLGKIRERMNDDIIRLLHAAMGLATEAGEFVDALKKHIFYGKELKLSNLIEEIGDGQWYAGVAIDVLQTTLEDVLTINIAKLRARYPEKFTEDAALNRDLEVEEKILEQPAVDGTKGQAFVLALGRELTEDQEDRLRDELKAICEKFDVTADLLPIAPLRAYDPATDTTTLVKEAAEC